MLDEFARLALVYRLYKVQDGYLHHIIIEEFSFDGRNTSLVIFLNFHLLTPWKELITGKKNESILK